MARIDYEPDGTILRLLTNEREEAAIPVPPGASSLAFDATTNADLLDGLSGRLPGVLWQDHRVVAGLLQRQGVPVPLAPPSRASLDRQARAALLTKLEADQALTAVELRTALRLLLRPAGALERAG